MIDYRGLKMTTDGTKGYSTLIVAIYSLVLVLLCGRVTLHFIEMDI